MLRPIFAFSIILAVFQAVSAAEPKPLWQIDVGGGKQATSPAWISYSPDGRFIAAVVVHETYGERPEFKYQLRVWNGVDRKERFTADLGSSRTPHLDDNLASFPSDDTILTGGQTLAVRSLENGQITSSYETGGTADYAVWSVADIQESFHLRREPLRYGLPAVLLYQSFSNNLDQFGGQFGGGLRARRWNQQATENAQIDPPRTGLHTDNIAMNFGRTQVAVAFRDETPTIKPRHALVLHEIKTVDGFTLIPVAEAVNPHQAPVSAMAFARNGKTLVTGGEDGSLALWDTEYFGTSWKPRATVEGMADHRVFAITFSRDWSMIAAVTWDKSKPNLLLVDGDTGKVLKAVRLERELCSVAFSSDGQTLLTGSALGKLKAWDVGALLKSN